MITKSYNIYVIGGMSNQQVAVSTVFKWTQGKRIYLKWIYKSLFQIHFSNKQMGIGAGSPRFWMVWRSHSYGREDLVLCRRFQTELLSNDGKMDYKTHTHTKYLE
jgi:hypothetical protein